MKTIKSYQEEGHRVQLLHLGDLYQIRDNRRIISSHYDLVAAMYAFRAYLYQIMSQMTLSGA